MNTYEFQECFQNNVESVQYHNERLTLKGYIYIKKSIKNLELLKKEIYFANEAFNTTIVLNVKDVARKDVSLVCTASRSANDYDLWGYEANIDKLQIDALTGYKLLINVVTSQGNYSSWFVVPNKFIASIKQYHMLLKALHFNENAAVFNEGAVRRYLKTHINNTKMIIVDKNDDLILNRRDIVTDNQGFQINMKSGKFDGCYFILKKKNRVVEKNIIRNAAVKIPFPSNIAEVVGWVPYLIVEDKEYELEFKFASSLRLGKIFRTRWLSSKIFHSFGSYMLFIRMRGL